LRRSRDGTRHRCRRAGRYPCASHGTTSKPPITAAASTRAARAAAAAALAFCLATAFAAAEARFVTTPDAVTLAMLKLAAVTARDHVVDLGSGDGRIVITAARRFGARGLGIEIVPELVRISRERARAAGVDDRVEFREQDLFGTDLGAATVVTMYRLPEINLAQAAPARARAGNAHRLARLGPGSRFPTRGSAATSSRASISGSSRRASPAGGAPTARASTSRSASSASRRRSRSAAAPLPPPSSTAASRPRRCAATAFTLRLDGETLSLIGAGGTSPAQAFVRAGSGACR
jgi:hypothetical protein